MTFEEYWEEVKKDYEESGDPVWNWGNERYREVRREELEIYNELRAEGKI